MATIGERIALLLKENSLKKVQFAEKLRIHQSYVTKLVKDQTMPSDALVNSICREFGVSEEWLRHGIEPMKVQAPTDELSQILQKYGLPVFLRGLLLRYAKLSPGAQKEVEAQIRAWATELAAQPEPVQPEHNVHEWTDAEMHAELQRQLDAEKEETDESSTFFSGNSGMAIA